MKKPPAKDLLEMTNQTVDLATKEKPKMTKPLENTDLFEMTKLPFGKGIGKDELFSYRQLEELKVLIRLAINERTFMLLTAEVGAGKTTAVRAVTDELPTNKYHVVYLGQDQNGANLCRRLAYGLGLQPKRSRSHTWMQISQFLSENLTEQAKNIIVVVDEAHLLDDTTLEEIRLLSNADFDRTSPLTVILMGQLQLRSRLKAGGFDALNQRFRLRYALEGFTQEETMAYISHHLTLVGLPDDLIDPEAAKAVFLACRGIPRAINNACLLSLLKAKEVGATKIDAKLIRQVLDLTELN